MDKQLLDRIRLRAGKRDGIALILVLGMLALLMLIGVTFSVTMRVERDGAGSYSAMVSARQLVESAVANAMAAVDTSMEKSTTTNNLDFIFPRWSLLSSSGVGDAVNLAWGEALEHIPGSLQAQAQTSRCSWVESSASYGTRARVAYLVVNLSDMLDANAVGAGARMYGTGGADEVQFGRLPEVQDRATLVAQRTADGRYESLEEFNLYQNAKGLKSGVPGQHFSTRVQALPGGYPNGQAYDTPLQIAGLNVANLESKEIEIKERFRLVLAPLFPAGNVPPADVDFLYLNLLDYVDVDSTPRDLASPCTERVPMINEIGGLVGIRSDGGVQARILVETVYPFLEPSPNTFELESTIRLEVYYNGTMTDGWDLPVDVQNTGYAAAPSGYYGAQAGQGAVYNTVQVQYGNTLSSPPTNGTYSVKIYYKGQVRLEGGGVVVDEAPTPYATAPQSAWIQVTRTPAPVTYSGGPMLFAMVSQEAFDPRFNWVKANFRDNPANLNSMGKINGVTDQLLAVGRTQRFRGMDWNLAMHVSDAGELKTVGELGALCRSPMRQRGFLSTIRLMDYYNIADPEPRQILRADRILDYFTNQATGSNRGLVNPNSLNPDRLACAFWSMPKAHPEITVNTGILGNAEVAGLVARLLAWRNQGESEFRLPTGGAPFMLAHRFDSLADLGRYNWRAETAIGGDSDVGLEALIGNSAGLMATRQNMFVAIVAAKPFSVGMGTASNVSGEGAWTGLRRAVVYFMRDPYPSQGGNTVCKTKVVGFKWLGDE